MAMQFDDMFCGIQLSESYVRVFPSTFASKTEVNCLVAFWASKQLALDGKTQPYKTFPLQVTYDLSSPKNLHTQCYEAIMALPEFASAVMV